MENNLSVVIITKNEEEKLDRCLKSLQNLNAEIVIVDSGSEDKTIEIAKNYTKKIYNRKFDNFANQRNWAVTKVSFDWILSVDADEVISPELAEEIMQAIKKDFSGFLIPRKNFMLGAEIKHSRWSPDKHIWLWNKKKGEWRGDVHEEVIVEGKIGGLKNSKLHYQEGSVRDFIQTNDLYSSLLSKQMVKAGVKFSLWRLFWDPIFEFFIRYFYKLGFLDGWRGFCLSYLMAIYKITVWIKIWENKNQTI